MRIQHNISSLNSYRQLNGNNNALSKNLEKLSSGYKINKAGDDAAGLAISEKMRSQIKGLTVASKNCNDAISLIQTAEGALTEVHSMLNRMVELATQSANGIYEDDGTSRTNLQNEIDALVEEIDRISDATKFSDIDLLKDQQLTFQVGDTADTFNQVSVTMESMKSDAIGTEGGTMINAIDISNQAGAQSAIAVINDAIDQVSEFRGNLGAVQNRLEHTINNLEVTTENMTSAESRIRDTDMADEITAYTKNNILVQASQAMLAQANTVPQGVLQLLQ